MAMAIISKPGERQIHNSSIYAKYHGTSTWFPFLAAFCVSTPEVAVADSLGALASRLSPAASVLFQPYDDECANANSAYINASYSYNPAFLSRPKAAIKCMTTNDVAESVRYLAERKLPFRIRASGHNLAGYSGASCSQYLLDLSGMTDIERSGDGTTSFGAGVRGDMLFDYLLPYREVVVSCAPSVHVLGMILAGGISELSTVQGMTTDLARELEVVLHNGTVINASASEHADLFKALRGAGGNSLGVVTRATIKAIPVPSEMGKGRYTFTDPSADSGGLKALMIAYRDEVVNSNSSGIPTPMGVYLTLYRAEDTTLFMLDWTYFGDAMQEAREALADWVNRTADAAGVSMEQSTDSTTYEDYVAQYAAKVGPAQLPEAWLSPFMTDFTDGYVDSVFQACDDAIARGASSAILLLLAEQVNGQPAGMLQSGDTTTSAFAFRATKFWWLDISSCPFGRLHVCEDWVRTLLTATMRDGDEANYLGLYHGIQSRALEAMETQGGLDMQEAFFAKNTQPALWTTLMDAKARYDPANVFCSPQSLVPCSAPSADMCEARGPSPVQNDLESSPNTARSSQSGARGPVEASITLLLLSTAWLGLRLW